MDCSQARSNLADLSAEHLSSLSETELRSHLAQCRHCHREWQTLQETLLILSTTTQALPSQEQSQQMWAACLEKWTEQVERQRTESQRSLWHWARLQPRWGWAALGSAIAVFGSVWWSSLDDDVSPATVTEEPVTVWVPSFERPPANTSPLINHHSAMAFDPFTDHVGSTLISYSATAPAAAVPAATTSIP